MVNYTIFLITKYTKFQSNLFIENIIEIIKRLNVEKKFLLTCK